jgi:ornithine carbamoyltransferase
MIDIYVVRDYSQKFIDVLVRKNDPPFINGFCKTGHPSQALADLSVIKWKKGKTKGLSYVGVCPETGSGVMESFIYGVLLLGERMTLITPTGTFSGKNLDFDETVKKLSSQYGGSLTLTKNISQTIATADVLYVDEWWENTSDFLNKSMGQYQVNQEFLKDSKPSLSIMHCLPAHLGREITEEVVRSPRSIIFDEAEFRVYSAMSLLCYLNDEQD